MSVWKQLGFRENPYSTKPIPANEEGAKLLVGRERELRRLQMSLTSSANHATIEGANGVGKTSLVGVAAFSLLQESLKNNSKPLYIPVDQTFQISSHESTSQFSTSFMITLAREISNKRDLVNQYHSGLRHLSDLDTWLNDPILTSGGGGASILGFGGSGSVNRSVNSGQGFASGGVESHLRKIMRAIFPENAAGGFVCVLDNLELLETSTKARAVLEDMRDGVLNFPGVRWVLCGARGILLSVASTTRMQGRLTAPIELQPLGADSVIEVVGARLETFKERVDAYTPVNPDGFKKIYQIANSNLRVALRYCEDFVFWCEETGSRPTTQEDKFQLLDVWFAEVTDKVQGSMVSVTPRAWRLFDAMARKPDGCSPGDFEEFDFRSGPAMQPHLRTLERANLIDSAQNDNDQRRKTITLTPLGCMIRYRRDAYNLQG